MGRPATIHVKFNKLWPKDGRGSVLRVGDTVIQFQERTRKHGRRVKIVSQRHKPKHLTLQVDSESA